MVMAGPPEVALAGFAYSGDASTIETRFPHSRRYEAALKATGDSPYKHITQALGATPAQNLSVVGQIAELKGQDQALAVALVVNSETASVEQFGATRKLLVLIKGQALFFDFKSMAIVRAYPVSFASIDNYRNSPSPAEILVQVRQVYEGTAEKPGLFARFATALATASLPSASTRYLQVSRATVAPEADALIPQALKTAPGGVETWLADIVAEAVSTRTGVPIIPFAKGYAVGNVMSMRVSDGEVFNLRLPKPDYEISVELSGFKKVKYGEAAAGASFIYGAYAALKAEEPLTGRAYLNTSLKNGEVKKVPVTQDVVDDFPAYYDALNLMFVKLAEALDGKGNTWVKAAAAAADIERQIAATRELIKLCK